MRLKNILNAEEFRPRRGLRGGHAQTLAGNFLPRSDRLAAPEERLFALEDGAQVRCHCHWQPERETRTTLVIVHGLEGSSASQYVIGTANKAFVAGMNVVRMNMRNCGGTEKLCQTLYHSGMSGDVGAVAKALIAEDRLPRVALAGFSMGGNLVLKLAGEWGRDHAAPQQLVAVAGISPAMDLAASAEALHWPQNRIYEWKFLWGLQRRMMRKAALFPDRFAKPPRFWRSLRDFDERVTAPYSGFTGADDYYMRASSAQVVRHIRVPTLVIHSSDDPFIKLTAETRAKLLANPHITFLETNHGGHCAFLADPNGYDGRWAERQIVEFVRQF
jgi:predicted alpha/beta-fold hydrolase